MKNKVIRLISLVVVISISSVNGNARGRSSQNDAGLNVGIYDFSNSLFGFNVFAKFGISDNIKIGGNLGYYFKSDNSGFVKTTSYVMPITGLFEYHFSDNDFNPYVGSDAGFYRLGSTGFISISMMKFGIAPTVGFDYKLSDKISINSNLKYHYIMVQGSNGVLSFNAGISFGF